MARSSRSKGSVSVDLFNLPTLPDERRVATSYLDIPVDFYLPDGKNSKISRIVSRQAFDRQTPDGNEGFVIEIQYLERAFCTKIYLIDKVTGSLFMVHDDHIESTGLCGSECVFDLQELEYNICELADQRNGEDDSVAADRQSTQTHNTKPLTLHPLQDHRQFRTIFLCMRLGKILNTKVNHSPSLLGNRYTKPVAK